MSLAVLEQLLPEFYKDARSLVKQDSFVKMKNGTLTTFKKPGTLTFFSPTIKLP